MSFSELIIKLKYHSQKSEILNDFYIPVLGKADEYKRAVGYFSSKILIDYIDGLEQFVRNEGKMYLIISPSVTSEDAEALMNSTITNSDLGFQVSTLFRSFKEHDEVSELAAKIMVALIKEKYLEVKVAVPKNIVGIFHEKIGVFKDSLGNRIAINGSNNETSNAVNYNIESFNTFCSWKEGQLEYVIEHESDFNEYWYNQSPDLITYKLEDALDKDILKLYETEEPISSLFKKLHKLRSKPLVQLNFKPYDFQKEDAEKWLNAKKGIVSYATGIGKTKLAIYSIYRYLEVFDKGFFLIVVPDKTLVNQWYDELKDNNYNSIKCYSDNQNWVVDLKDNIESWKYNLLRKSFVITTQQTFSGDSFQKLISKLKNDFVLIADECHHLGTNNLLNKLPNTDYRLGLSATPEIYLQQDRTDKLFAYFNGVIASYDIESAIKDGFLVPYEYYPIIVELTEDEKKLYDDLTRKIVKIIGSEKENKIRNANEALEMLLFKRARILYNASNKLVRLNEIIEDMVNESYFLVYCGVTSTGGELTEEVTNQSLTQLEEVNMIMKNHNIASAQYTQEESHIIRKKEIAAFRGGKLNSLIAIKCLDEGVNIPEIRKAIIMASSGNPREYIQRRGRLLRIVIGKTKAIIYDMVVFSPSETYSSINRVELKRLKEFAEIALNATEILNEYGKYIDEYIGEEENV